jgi:hypothetical protein
VKSEKRRVKREKWGVNGKEFLKLGWKDHEKCETGRILFVIGL